MWYQGGAAAPAGLALAAPTQAVRFFAAAPAPRKMFCTTEAKPTGPPAPLAWGGKGGRWVRPRRGGLLRILSVLAVRRLVFCLIGAGRRPEEGAPRSEERSDGAPRAPGVGGMGGVGCSARPAMSYKAGLIGA